MTDPASARRIALLEASLRELIRIVDHAGKCSTCVVDADECPAGEGKRFFEAVAKARRLVGGKT